MPTQSFTCKRCKYETDRKSSLKKHLSQKNACLASCEDVDRETLLLQLTKVTPFKCHECNKCYATTTTLKKHLELYCQNRKGNKQNIAVLRIYKNELVIALKQLEASCPSAKIPEVRNFSDPNLDYVGDHLFLNCFKDMDIVSVLENVYCNEGHPENISV